MFSDELYVNSFPEWFPHHDDDDDGDDDDDD